MENEFSKFWLKIQQLLDVLWCQPIKRFTLFRHQNFMNIDRMTLILFFFVPSNMDCFKNSIKALFGSFPSVIFCFSTIGIHQISIDQQKRPRQRVATALAPTILLETVILSTVAANLRAALFKSCTQLFETSLVHENLSLCTVTF